jgi:GH35 family endo-1,4-beta-xylanase
MRTFATRHRSWTCACVVGVIALLQIVVPTHATAQTIVSNGWEDGTTQGWAPRGAVALTSTTEAAATGTHSLKTTGRTATWQGPSLDLLPLLTPGTIYQFRISARLVAPQSATRLTMTVQRTTSDGTSYDTVAATSSTGATDTGWVTLQGTYSVPFCATGLVLYIESASATASFYVDDFSITVVPLVVCDPADPTGIHTSFETSTTEGWGPRGGVTLTAANVDSHTGAYSLLTTGRTATWQGPAINAAGWLCSGGRYNVSVWVKLAPGQPDTQIRVSIQRGLGSDTSYITVIGNTWVTANAWVHLTGNYDFGLTYTSLSLYVESNNNPTASFYIDDFDLTPTGLLPAVPPPYCPPGPPIATGQDKFLGCAYSNSQKVNFTAYWNQVTPENGGKWGSVEGTRDAMSWGEMDAAYALAKAKGFPVKLHALVWGRQQPSWIASLPEAEQLEEIQEWFQAAAARYPALDQVEVVNEPLHQPPPYMNALGGSGVTGWDWVLTAFRMARTYFPGAQLLINEYSVTNSATDMERYIAIIRLLQNEDLIDGVGVQGHYFSTREYFPGSAALQKANLDLLAQTGLPIYVTEMDIDGPTDEAQLADYQWIFPIYWDHPAVKGITMWGYRPGMWRTPQGAYLVYENGAERPAMVWLQEYVADTRPVVTAGQSFRIDGGACNVLGTVAGSDPDAATRPELAVLQNWKILGGSGEGIFAVDPATGSISIAKPLDIDFTRTSYEIVVSVSDGFKSSEPQTVTITIPRKIDVVHKGDAINIAKQAVPAHLREHGDCLGTVAIR